jgi:hypothetical protein
MASQAVLQLLVQMKDEASAGLSNVTGALGTLGTAGLAVAAAGVAAFGVALAGGVADAQASRALMAETEQLIINTGNAAGVTAQEVADLASSMSDAAGMSLFGDDQIQAAENMILKFKDLQVPIKDVTQLAIDMAQTLGTAPADAAKKLGLALQDPFNAAADLQKQGVMLTDTQLAVLASMEATGDAAGAQAVLVDALNATYAGQAQAAADAAGGMVQFKAGMGEAFETLGSKLLPLLDRLGAWLSSPAVQAAIGEFAERLGRGIEIAAAFIIDDLIPAITDLYNWLAPILGPILAELGRALSEDLPRGIDRVVTGWNTLKQALSDFKTGYIDPIVRGWQAITDAVSAAYDWFNKLSGTIAAIQIPSWLQGHSPPPLANWCSDIGAAAQEAGGAVNAVAPPGGTIAPLPGFGGATGGTGGAGGITVHVTVMGSVSTERDLVVAIRNGLRDLGQRNVDIFGEVA